eukprot:CAMPEP_0196657028 /NCGR_PEP_ID=MMETSP1086-20130531/21301_1 /TAXON_ID=77921 /ORGANISM="Cyanoptyche  gloeocystis , Strain SAG4.97" /LENGTH=224 /DNA_ID=CAMNT_0041990013 /DNA_START=53 /DNA_END=727 /DNA_ORIENTATION=+
MVHVDPALAKILGDDWQHAAHSMGTSIMAAEFDGGVVMGADSRTTTGSYIANRASDKITPVSEKIYCCRSGSAADTQAISDYVKYFMHLHSAELDEEPSVETAAHLFKQLCYNNKNNLSAGIIIGGADKSGGSVYSIPLGGSLVKVPYTMGGSGSTYIYGYCDATWKKGMTQDECKQWVTNALSLAMSRDGSSGGLIRLVTITSSGVTRDFIPGNKLPTFDNPW